MTHEQKALIGHIYKEIADLVHSTGSPRATVEQFGDYSALRYVVAVAVNCKAWDGRIDPRNANWARETTSTGTAERDYFPHIDEIHPSHLDQLASVLRR